MPSFSMTEFSRAEEENDARNFRTESTENCGPVFHRWTSKGNKDKWLFKPLAVANVGKKMFFVFHGLFGET